MANWKDIPGYEGIYEASDCGEIRSSLGKMTVNARCTRVWHQRVLRQSQRRRKSGGRVDMKVKLWKDGVEHTLLVSRLVAMTWCEGYASGMTVNHIDGNTLNNRADNLEWVTRADNIRMGFRDGMYGSIQKPVTLICGEERHWFPSMTAASAFCGRSQAYISTRVRHGKYTTKHYRIEMAEGYYGSEHEDRLG